MWEASDPVCLIALMGMIRVDEQKRMVTQRRRSSTSGLLISTKSVPLPFLFSLILLISMVYNSMLVDAQANGQQPGTAPAGTQIGLPPAVQFSAFPLNQAAALSAAAAGTPVPPPNVQGTSLTDLNFNSQTIINYSNNLKYYII
jgi:hypothetical protein